MNDKIRVCYGFTRNFNNEVVLNENALNVFTIFSQYLSGKSLRDVAEHLKQNGVPSPSGKPEWTPISIEKILLNTVYLNHVVPHEMFEQVQYEMQKRSNIIKAENESIRKTTRYSSKNILSGLLVCKECGNNYRRITKHDGTIIWRCSNRVEHGNQLCHRSPSVSEQQICSAIRTVLGDDFTEKDIRVNINKIIVRDDQSLEIEMKQ